MWQGHVAKRLHQEQDVELSFQFFLGTSSYIDLLLFLAKGHTNFVMHL